MQATRSAITPITTSRGCTYTPRTKSKRSWRARKTRSKPRPASGRQVFAGRASVFRRQCCAVLTRRGYRYDASTFPTFLGPIARAYYFAKSRSMNKEEKHKRKQLFGKLSEGLRPLRPYRWTTEEGAILEVPVTTMPVAKVPIHLSYLLYLACYSPTLARYYWAAALRMCRLTRTEPSLLLHPLDFLGGDDVSALDFFPAMRMPGLNKVALVGEFLDMMARHFDLVPLGVHADAIAARPRLPIRRAD